MEIKKDICIHVDHNNRRCPNEALAGSNYCATHSPEQRRSAAGGGGGGGNRVLYDKLRGDF